MGCFGSAMLGYLTKRQPCTMNTPTLPTLTSQQSKSPSNSDPAQCEPRKSFGTLRSNTGGETHPLLFELPLGTCESKPKRWRSWKDSDPKAVLAEMKSCVDYLPSGEFVVTRRRHNNAKPVGELLGSATNNGYSEIRFLGRNFFVHNLVWLWHHGAWPIGELDHINGVRTDNRIENLRDVNRGVNLRNAKMKSTNTSGFTGVYFVKALNKWKGCVTVNYRVVYRCYGQTAEEASALREKWIAAHPHLGFTERHGKDSNARAPLEIDLAGMR